MPTRHDARRAVGGFTLAELLLAATLGSLLVTAAASSAGTFSETVAQLRSDLVDDYDTVAARIAAEVRYAWWVDVPARDHLRIADSAGDLTEYTLVGNSLLVKRPSGDEGAVITGLADLEFEQTTMRRLRNDDTVVANGPLASVPAPFAASSARVLGPGEALALAFTIPSSAGPQAVAGVNERRTTATPTSLDLFVASVGVLGMLHGDIYASRAPGDARPRPGAVSLASFDVPLLSVPLAGILGAGPPVVYSSPLVSIPINLTNPQALRPGVGYTLQLSTRAGGTAVVPCFVNAAGNNPGVVYRPNAASAWTQLANVVPISFAGNSVRTATEAQDVASQIRIALTPTGQDAHIASAAVFSQVLAGDPWLGVVPGETPPTP